MLSSATTSPIKIMPESPFKLPKSASGGDIVSGIVGRFESLSVTDNGEEREKFERQITKLKAALDRAQIAREEAESEARKLREKLLDLQDERQKEKTALKERAQEYEVRRTLHVHEGDQMLIQARVEKVREGQGSVQDAARKERRLVS